MARIIDMECIRAKKAAQRGFKEWGRVFQTFAEFNEKTRWCDLPDWVILALCEESEGKTRQFYDLIMRTHRLGTGHDFESLPAGKLVDLLNVYFFITDQARFECMRRLGWILSIPRGDESLIEVVLDPRTLEYGGLYETPAPTSQHPAFEEDARGRGVDRALLVRKHIPEAIEAFRDRLRAGESETT